jgi:antirestriction protein
MNSNPEQWEAQPRDGPSTPERERPTEPRIYVASLSDYNNGRLHGAWINAAQDATAISEQIGEMLASSECEPAEEYAIHDYEGFGAFAVDEYENVTDVARIGLGIAEHGPAFAAFAAHLDRADWQKLDEFDDHFRGQWNGTAEFGEDLLRDIGVELDNIGPEILQPYITVDFEAFGRDLAYDYMVCDDGEGGVYVFEND